MIDYFLIFNDGVLTPKSPKRDFDKVVFKSPLEDLGVYRGNH